MTQVIKTIPLQRHTSMKTIPSLHLTSMKTISSLHLTPVWNHTMFTSDKYECYTILTYHKYLKVHNSISKYLKVPRSGYNFLKVLISTQTYIKIQRSTCNVLEVPRSSGLLYCGLVWSAVLFRLFIFTQPRCHKSCSKLQLRQHLNATIMISRWK